jgi:adenosylcobinamide-phosphate synthase
VIETVSENLSDGVIAPLFYLAIGGLPLAIAYKAINTLDSMVGYKNEKYLSFGWAAARLDDVANFIPARLTGILIVLASFCYFLVRSPGGAFSTARDSFRVMRRDGRNHTSPNSGIPEAAMAGCLGVRLGGPSTYGGVLVQKPFIGDDRTGDYGIASERSIGIVLLASCIAVLGAVATIWLRGLA